MHGHMNLKFTHFMFTDFIFYRATYEIMWKNIVEPDRPQIICCMRTACWIPKATNTRSEYVTLIHYSV